MSRRFLVVLALLGLARSPVAAQTCMGLASYSSGPVQVAGHGSLTTGADAGQVGASLGYGRPGSLFADVAAAMTSVTGTKKSLAVGIDAGYQVQVGAAQICPVAAVALSNGPDGMGVNGSTRSATVGFALGTAIGVHPVQVVPTAGLTLEYSNVKLEDAFNSGSASDGYGVGHLGVGLIFNSISVRPGVEIPLGLEGADPVLGLTVGLNFGSKR
jgi:hypothetical protein